MFLVTKIRKIGSRTKINPFIFYAAMEYLIRKLRKLFVIPIYFSIFAGKSKLL